MAVLESRAIHNGQPAAHGLDRIHGEVKRGLPYPEELRSRVVAAIEKGASYRQAAARHGVSPSVAMKWARAFRQTGSLAARPMGGDRRSRLKGERDWVLRRIASEPDLTLADLHRELCARGIEVAYLTMRRFLKKEKIVMGRAGRTRRLAARSAAGSRAG
jgi:transposase